METKSKSKPTFQSYAFSRSLSDGLFYLACAISFCGDESVRSVLISAHDSLVKIIGDGK